MQEITLEAESALLRRNFTQALSISNSALLQDVQTRKFSCYNGKQCDQTGASQLITMSTPLHLLEWAHGENAGKSSPWRVCVSNDVSERSRLAAVALQSAAELAQCSERFAESKETTRTRILQNIHPFIETFSGSFDCKEHMPLELAIIWVKFCRLVECKATSILLGAEILSGLSHQQCHTDQNEWIMNVRSDLAHFLFVDALLFFDDIQFVEEVLSFLDDGKDLKLAIQLGLESCASRSLVPQRQSLEMISAFLRNWGSRKSVSGVFQCEIRDILRHIDTIGTAYKYRSGNVTNGMKERISDNLSTNHALPDESSCDYETESSLSSRIQSRIVYPLWSSENRWMNRLQVAAAGIVVLTAWQRRRRVVSFARSVSQAGAIQLLGLTETIRR